MTDALKNALLKDNIQCIDNVDGKFVFLRAGTSTITSGQSLKISSLFSTEIPVGSILIVKASENAVLKTLVFVCCNASQADISLNIIKNNLFWFEITASHHYISPK